MALAFLSVVQGMRDSGSIVLVVQCLEKMFRSSLRRIAADSKGALRLCCELEGVARSPCVRASLLECHE